MASISPPPSVLPAPAPSNRSESSITTVADAVEEPRARSPLDQEIERDELHIEKYGGDDPDEPAPKTPGKEAPPHAPSILDAHKVTWDGPDDPKNPQNWSKNYKWFITGVCSILTVNVTFASSAPSAATTHIQQTFGTTAEVSYLVTTCFLLGYVFGPLFWGPGSKLIGRQKIFYVTMTLYTLFHLGQALAQNIETLLVTRFLSGFFAVAPLTNCGGVIADIWSAEGRGPATSLFTASVFLGPVLGPIIGGYITTSYLGWRWVFWVMMIFAGVCTLSLAFLPETYAPIILQKKARRMRKAEPEQNKDVYAEHEREDWTLKGIARRSILRPFHMLFMEPILVLITIYLSLVYGILYCLFEAFPLIFVVKRGFTIGEDGLVFIGVGIGTTLGALLNYYLTAHYPELIRKWRGFPPPEHRLFGAMIGAPSLVIGIFWLGWTGAYASVPWYVPALSAILIGLSISLIFMSFLSYLVDTYLMYSASAFAANTVIRSATAAAFPLFTIQMFNGMGIQWACTLIGLVGLVLTPSPFLFYVYGARIRASSTFAPCIDLRIAKVLAEEEAAARKNQEV